jgi:uncharacterized protein (DUF2384 family)
MTTDTDAAKSEAIAKLVVQVQNIVNEAGDPAGFDADLWVRQWIEKPIGALGGRRPVDLIDTEDGRELVTRVLAMAQSGAYG